MKKLLLLTAAMIGLLASCRGPAGGSSEVVDPNQKTTIVFDNTQGICAVTVYSSYIREEETKIARIPAGRLSQEIEWLPGASMAFFFSYQISFKGISGFAVNYIPIIGKDQKQVRVDPNIKTTIPIPPLAEALTSPDVLLSRDSYLLIQNNSSYSLQLLRGTSIIRPDNMSETVVNSGERAQYTINPGAASNYKLLVSGNTIPFPGSLVSFEAGCVYSFVYDGSISLISEVEMKLDNVAGISPNKPVPEAPAAPAVTAFDSLLTVRWTAVEGAESYEVYIGTGQEPPALPQRTVYSPTTVFGDLTNKTMYYVWVKAANENGASGFSPRARGIPWPTNEVPAAPGRPSIIPGINQLTVNWEEAGGASSYEVYINTAPSAPSSAAVTTDKTSAVMTNLENDVIYYIWVCAVNSAGKSGYSPFEAGTPQIPTAIPAAPGIPALVARNRELAVSWQVVGLADAYEVWFGTFDDSAQAQKFGGDISGGITEIIVTGLTNETTYYVWIKAKNVVGTSGLSLPASGTPSAFTVAPQAPSAPAIMSGNGQLTVSWQAVEGATAYEIWLGTTNNSASAVKNGADEGESLSRTISSLTNGTTYYIWLKAKNNVGTSGFSSAANGKPIGNMAAVTVNPGGGGELILSWTAVAGADQYEVYCHTADIIPISPAQTVTVTTATIGGLTNGTTYYAWVIPKNANGSGGVSTAASGTPVALSTYEMVYVSGGSFEMGRNPGSGSDGHTVTLTGFYIGKYEVTQSQWQAVMGTTIGQQQAWAYPMDTPPANYGRGDAYPMYCVNWYDAVEFCNKLSEREGRQPVYTITGRSPSTGYPITSATVTADWSRNGYRLPTEAQWEYAAKGGDPTAAGWVEYTYAGSDTIDDVAWYNSNSGSAAHAVGTKAANRLGIYDMSGNVREWCWDWYGFYTDGAQTDPTGASSGFSRMARGGSWNFPAEAIRSAFRDFENPSNMVYSQGFRVVRPAQ